MGGLLQNRYVSVRKKLDDLGYQDAFGVDSLALVERLFMDLLKATDNLQKYVQESTTYKKIAHELEEGVEPFKEENLKLIKENSQLRLALQRNEEGFQEKVQGTRSKLRDLESENSELKLLITHFVDRVKKQEIDSLEKTRRMAQLQERNLQASVITPDGTKKNTFYPKQGMEIDDPAPKLCPHCIRIRNFVQLGKYRDPTPIDYIQVADSRIEALTLQNRSLKSTQQDLMDLIKSLKVSIESRESELQQFKLDIKLGVPGGRNNWDASGGDHDVEDHHYKDLRMALKSAQLQMQILQKRNLNLEKKLQTNLLQVHDDFVLNRSNRTAYERQLHASLMDINGDCYIPTSDSISMEEKLTILEKQLSHCCKEKAKLKALLADCESKHAKRRTTPDRDVPSKVAIKEVSSEPVFIQKKSVPAKTRPGDRSSKTKLPAQTKYSQKTLVQKPSVNDARTGKKYSRSELKSSAQNYRVKSTKPSSYDLQTKTQAGSKNFVPQPEDDNVPGKKSSYQPSRYESRRQMVKPSDSNFQTTQKTSKQTGLQPTGTGSSEYSESTNEYSDELAQQQPHPDGTQPKQLPSSRTQQHEQPSGYGSQLPCPPRDGSQPPAYPAVFPVPPQPAGFGQYSDQPSDFGNKTFDHRFGYDPQGQLANNDEKLTRQPSEFSKTKQSQASGYNDHNIRLPNGSVNTTFFNGSQQPSFSHPAKGQPSAQFSGQAGQPEGYQPLGQASGYSDQPPLQNTGFLPSQFPQQPSVYGNRPVSKQQPGFPSQPVSQQQPGFPSQPVSQQHSGFPSQPVSQQHSGFPSQPVSQQHSGFPSQPVSQQQSSFPTQPPSQQPSGYPSQTPSQHPSGYVSQQISQQPSGFVSLSNSQQPSSQPIQSASHQPSAYGSQPPSQQQSGFIDQFLQLPSNGQSSQQPSGYIGQAVQQPLNGGQAPQQQPSGNIGQPFQQQQQPSGNIGQPFQQQQQPSGFIGQPFQQQQPSGFIGQPFQQQPSGFIGQPFQQQQPSGYIDQPLQQPLNGNQASQQASRPDGQRLQQSYAYSGQLSPHQTSGHSSQPQQPHTYGSQAHPKQQPGAFGNPVPPQQQPGTIGNQAPTQQQPSTQSQQPHTYGSQAHPQKEPGAIGNQVPPQQLPSTFGSQAPPQQPNPNLAPGQVTTEPVSQHSGFISQSPAQTSYIGQEPSQRSGQEAEPQHEYTQPYGLQPGQPQLSEFETQKPRSSQSKADSHQKKSNSKGETHQKGKAAGAGWPGIMGKSSKQAGNIQPSVNPLEFSQSCRDGSEPLVRSTGYRAQSPVDSSQATHGSARDEVPPHDGLLNQRLALHTEEGNSAPHAPFRRQPSVKPDEHGKSSSVQFSVGNTVPPGQHSDLDRESSAQPPHQPRYDEQSGEIFKHDQHSGGHGLGDKQPPGFLGQLLPKNNDSDEPEDNLPSRKSFGYEMPKLPSHGMTPSKQTSRYGSQQPKQQPALDSQPKTPTFRQPPKPDSRNERLGYGYDPYKPSSSQQQSRNLASSGSQSSPRAPEMPGYGSPQSNFPPEYDRHPLYPPDQGNRQTPDADYGAYAAGTSGYLPTSLAKLRQDTQRERDAARPGSYVPFTTLPSDNKADTQELFRRMRGMERIIDNLQMEANLAKVSKTDLEKEIMKLRRALAECQEHGRQLNSENQKNKIILEQTQALLSDTQRKAAANYVPTQRENQELNQQVRQLMAREMVLEREVTALTTTVKALDRDKDEMRVELDRKDEKLARIQAENRQCQEQIEKLQLQNKDAELKLGHSGEASRDQEREMYQLKRQIDVLKADLDHRIRERDNAQKELNRLVQSCSRTEVDKRSMAVELEKCGKESDELRKQLQKYIDEVRRIEELLIKKEEEMELLMENYQVITHEKVALESQRSIMERESTSIRTDMIGAGIALTSKLSTQHNIIQTYEEEIAQVSAANASLENQLKNCKDREKMLQMELSSSRELCLKLESKLDSLKLSTANAESAKNKLQAENTDLRATVELLEKQFATEEETRRKLEDILAKLREKEYKAQESYSVVNSERDELKMRLTTLQSRTDQLKDEIERYRMKSAELQSELEKTRRQYQNEKIERESALAELKMLQAQLSSSSTSLLLTSTLAPSRTSSPSPYLPSSGGRQVPPDLSPVTQPDQLSTTRFPSPDPT